MRIPSGKTDIYLYFVAYDSADHTTRKTGLSGFTVYRSRNGAAEVAYTTPTVTEIDTTNMPGVYALLVDEDTTIASTSDSEEYTVHITVSGMDPVTRSVELYRRDTTSGNTASVDSSGRVDIGKWLGTAVTLTSSLPDVNTKTIANGIIAAATFAANALDAVWSTATRLLTAGTNIVLAKGTGITGFNDLDAAGVRSAIGLAAADIDTQLSGINTKTANLPSDPADQSLVAAATDAVMARLGAPVGASMSADIAAVKSDAGAIKTQTDKITFTVANQIDANIKSVNNVTVTGTGVLGDEWGP